MHYGTQYDGDCIFKLVVKKHTLRGGVSIQLRICPCLAVDRNLHLIVKPVVKKHTLRGGVSIQLRICPCLALDRNLHLIVKPAVKKHTLRGGVSIQLQSCRCGDVVGVVLSVCTQGKDWADRS